MTKESHQFGPEGVVHFAGLKLVTDGITQPQAYYLQNGTTTVNVLQAMDHVGCQKIVFSSSATVYGQPEYLPYDEARPIEPVSPYGRSKRMIEQILHDWTGANKTASAICLRYFNPAGAHPSGQIGEAPKGTPNNLLPYLAQVASGRHPLLTIFLSIWAPPATALASATISMSWMWRRRILLRWNEAKVYLDFKPLTLAPDTASQYGNLSQHFQK